MRILGEINDLPFKLTVLTMNNRISVKCEDGEHELTFKFRDGSMVQSYDDVVKYLTASQHIRSIQSLFTQMKAIRKEFTQTFIEKQEIEFPEII